MGENRSFDNLLGWLYTPENLPAGQTFDGLAFGDYANVAPTGERIAAHVYEGATDVVMGQPNPDPGEEYPARQHAAVRHGRCPPRTRPARPATCRRRSTRRPPGTAPTMDGFVHDYVNNIERSERQASDDRGRVADHGRLLARAAAGAVDAGAGVRGVRRLVRRRAVADLLQPVVLPRVDLARLRHEQARRRLRQMARRATPAPTIFNRLEDAGISWKVYFDEMQLVSLTGVHARSVARAVLAHRALRPHVGVLRGRRGRQAARVRLHRAADGLQPQRLPSAVRRVPQRAMSTVRRSLDSAVSDVRAGEKLVASVYDAIKASATADGSNAMNTLLLITFDEHGGTYDHVAPAERDAPDGGCRTRARWASRSIGSAAASPRSPCRRTRAAARSSTTRCTTAP